MLKKGLAAKSLFTTSAEKPKATKSDSVARLAFKTRTEVGFSGTFIYSVLVVFCFFSTASLQDTRNKLSASVIVNNLLNFFMLLLY